MKFRRAKKSCKKKTLRILKVEEHSEEKRGEEKDFGLQEREELYYWANLKVDVCKYVKECYTCQIKKHLHKKK